MIFLLDTNAVSDVMRDHNTVRSYLNGIAAGDRAITCTIVRGEVLYGIGQLPDGRRKADLLAKAQVVFASLPCEAVPPSAGDRYSQTKLAQRAKGLMLDENDLWIAATALELGAALVTRDKDFRRVESLQVVDWTVLAKP